MTATQERPADDAGAGAARRSSASTTTWSSRRTCGRPGCPRGSAARGPRVERKRWGAFSIIPGARYEMTEDPDGLWGDAWYFDDKLIYVHKRFVAIPLEATPDGDLSKFDRTKMVMTAVTYDEMRPGCYDRDARIEDFERNWTDGSLPFPTFPRFCGQTFSEQPDRELGLACVQAYNDWMVEEWCAPFARHQHPAVHHAVVGRRPRGRRDPTQRRARRPGVLLQRAPAPPEAADDPQRRMGSGLRRLQRDRRDALHAHRLVVDEPGRVARRTEGRRRHARVQQLDGVARRLAVLRQADPVPEAEARVLRGPDRLDPVRARAGRHRLGPARQLAALEGADPGAAVDATTTAGSSAASPPTTTDSPRSTRSASTTSASRPTTRTPTPRGRTRRSTSRRCSPGSATRSPTRCCAATRSGCSSSTASDAPRSSRIPSLWGCRRRAGSDEGCAQRAGELTPTEATRWRRLTGHRRSGSDGRTSASWSPTTRPGTAQSATRCRSRTPTPGRPLRRRPPKDPGVDGIFCSGRVCSRRRCPRPVDGCFSPFGSRGYTQPPA